MLVSFSEEDFFELPSEPTLPQSQRRRPPKRRLPLWPMALLLLGLVLIILALVGRDLLREGGADTVAPVATKTEEAPSPGSTPELPKAVDPSPVQTRDLVETQPPSLEEPTVSLEPVEAVDSGAWFSDAVLIGDSRVAGLRLYSGITAQAAFLDHTGLTVYEVKDGKKVIRRGEQKVSVLDALSEGDYAKVYLALGVNELGYFDPQGFAETYGQVVEAVRERLPEARVYIQSLIPVNTAKCKANQIPYYITNEGVASYNEALEDYFSGKDVCLLGIPEDLLDESGEVLSDYSADGVHFKRDGYVIWLNYLSTHTEG